MIKAKGYLDLLRLHFFFVWPTLFCAGLFLGFFFYGSFSLITVLQAVLIGFLGFEAGLVLNDIVDANIDKKELPSDNKLTKYWRPFGNRPISQALISRKKAVLVFVVLVALTATVIVTLPYPHSLYVFVIMLSCYCLEAFYQLKKRHESFPIAQIIGRMDFALFLVAGYLVVGQPDLNALLLFLFFYPLALAHLGVNDLIDVSNDIAKGLKTIPTLYSTNFTAYWILAFSMLHFITAIIFLTVIGTILPIAGFAVSLTILAIGNFKIMQEKNPQTGIKVLPLFHVAMLIYAITIILNFFIPVFL
ncbi:MAG: UbiA family prenyltransferase [Candidatus Bathyarchaeia archaeon]